MSSGTRQTRIIKVEIWTKINMLTFVLCNKCISNFILFFKMYLFILAALGLCCCVQAFSICGKQKLLLAVCAGFSLWWLLLLQNTGSRHVGFSSCGLWASCSAACGIFPDQGLTHVPCIGRQILNHCTSREACISKC